MSKIKSKLKYRKNILLITGAYPPIHCGVGDYTYNLRESLNQKGIVAVDLFYKSDWSIKLYFKYIREIYRSKCDVFHFQYPTEGFGYSMLPLLLLISLFRKQTVVTVHELSSRNMLAYIYTQILIFFSNKVIVSNNFEKKHACRFLFQTKKVNVIPIASNIKESKFCTTSFGDRGIDLAYFGHIRPIKGIESFLKTVSLLNEKYKVQLIGQFLDKYSDFFEKSVIEAKKLNVEMVLNKNEDEVADILSRVKIIYLPFPDGISNRRGTLLASIQNGCVVVSTKSEIKEFNEYFDDYCYLVDSIEEAVIIIRKLLNRELLSKKSVFATNPFSWENVVYQHLKVYDDFN